MSKYASFAELAAQEQEGRDFRALRIDRPDSPVAIIAPHGGEIEAGTSDIAGMIAGTEHSLFCFEGLKADGRNRDLHITSHRFDHPDCLAVAARAQIVLSVHGCKGHGQIFVGGLDEELAAALAGALTDAGYDVVAQGHRFPGRHPMNICNRGLRRRGAQLELTHDLRRPGHFAAIAAAARSALSKLVVRLRAAGTHRLT
jgi:phage replication-related protein YjqB (UPF0714/DUF867 family)